MDQSLIEKVYSTDDFEEKGHALINLFSKHLQNTISSEKERVIQWSNPEVELSYWKDFLANKDPKAFFEEVLKRTTHTHHPKYVGHQVAAPAPITVLTGALSSLLNNGMAVYEMGMSPTAMERIVTDKLAEKIGYDSQSRGILTSGGTLANLTALLAARKAKVLHDVWNEGHSQPLGIMVSEQAHYCVDRAAKIMGLGNKGIIKLPVRDNFAMDVDRLEEYYGKAMSQGIHVFAIVGSAPATATGAYDNLEAIGNFAQKHNLWFHVDGAHGGAAIFSEKYMHLLNGIEKSDSVVIDGHKMMLMPTITTALVFKDGSDSHSTFSQKADYLLIDTEEEDWYNGGKRTFECTKSMMSLHWFIILKMYGEEVFDSYLTRQYDLAREFASFLTNETDFELAVEPMSNILCFRWIKPGENLAAINSINESIRQKLLDKGEFYLVQTKLKGVHYLRTSLMNPFTTMDHLKELAHQIRSIGKNHVKTIN
ncbi:pyridoxal phosphate-dependent decarboxylase family protein [Flagellimonas allohymeniacidonis]|uniref:Aminotransferase class V-fold PLP-dependent enzyme n=1 Tax=Flagellimonas allohymeniacidonis TaxID=2517819 RepID=A0A4Q8QHF1_9FLAO|nr:aminotransferase class I/II-fold pyridoxal phosphate-dependent enzyme [Allomuricauda hymeniacidonis]TAI49197.1 aminotransferase class V-fold PLP-dependent enzyme [Allomuricauda hymeniacidonis]